MSLIIPVRKQWPWALKTSKESEQDSDLLQLLSEDHTDTSDSSSNLVSNHKTLPNNKLAVCRMLALVEVKNVSMLLSLNLSSFYGC